MKTRKGEAAQPKPFVERRRNAWENRAAHQQNLKTQRRAQNKAAHAARRKSRR